jgi:vancomycin resistance protein YoaR
MLWLLGGILAIAIIGIVAFALAWQGQYAGKMYPGVMVLDTDMSGKTQEEARKLLDDKVQGFLAQPVTFAWRGKEWRPSADQIGLKIDTSATVNEAFNVGRSGDMATNISQQWLAAGSGYMVPLTIEFDETALDKYLNSIATTEINQELFEGDVRLNGTEVQAIPGKEGRALRVYDTILNMREHVSKLESSKIDLPVEITQPAVSAQEVMQIEGLLNIRISSPITATVPGNTLTLTLDRQAIVRFTTIERNPDRSAPRHIELGWKDNELKILADRWAEQANRQPQNARFAWNNGSVSVLSESVDGFEIDSTAIITSIKEHSGTSDKRAYELPGKVIPATVSSKDVNSLGIKERIGTGTSTFQGSSPERATNIRVAADLLNGAVVPPGGTFSFLQAMGGIDEAHGFVEGYVIAAERTQKGVGGGVCQVSTTAFRAAFWSGVEITERNQHSYRVGWYEAGGEPVGFDAAVFDPGVDLKFVNNTPGYLLIQSEVSPDTLTVSFYGTRMPGEVKLEGPAISNRVPPPPDVYEVDPRLPPGSKKQVETARAGLTTVITRRIVVPGQPDKGRPVPQHVQGVAQLVHSGLRLADTG